MKCAILTLLMFGACTSTTDYPELSFEPIPQSLEQKRHEAQELAILIFKNPKCRQRFVNLSDFPPGVIRDDLIWDYSVTVPGTLASTADNGDFHFTVVPVSTVESMSIEELAVVYLHEAFHKADWSSVDFNSRASIMDAERRAVAASNRCMEDFTGYTLEPWTWVPKGVRQDVR